MILLKNKDKKANIKIGNNIEIKDGNDFPFDLTLYGKSTQATRSGKNLYNVNDTVATSDASISKSSTGFTATRTSTSSSDLFVASHTKTLKANTTYTFYKNRTNSSTCYFYSDNLFGTALTRNIIKSTEDSIIYTFVTDSTGKVVIGFYSANQTQGDTITLSNIMILEGEYSSENIPDYEPYGVMPSPDYPSPIESITEISATVTGKNLFDENELTLNKTQVDNKTCYEIAGTTATTSNVLLDKQLEENTQYTLSMVAKKVQYFNILYFYYTDGTETHQTFTNTNFQKISITSTANKTINKILIDTGDRSAKNYIEVGTIQLEKSTVATDYEEYKSNSLTIDLQGNELCSLPNGTKDEVNITNGEALLIKRIKKVVFDGSDDENWSFEADTNRFSMALYDAINKKQRCPIISNYFKYSVNTNEVGIGFVYLSRIYLYPKSDITTADEFKTWLSTHNVEVLYELAEPETINLGTVEMPHTYEGVSNITNSADTEMIVKYYKKFEFDKILRSGYNIDEQEYEIAKKQMANGKRKKILSSYVDCIIKIDLGLLDNKTYQEYKGQLEDGEYEYWSYKYNQYKKANFILTKPSITTEYAYDDEIGIDDMEITLEKSSDVS